MIPTAYIQEWTAATPWPDPRQVEQDLIICRALCDIFNEPWLADRLAFRGGTAINKFLFRQPLRSSEDIDLVQVRPEPIGSTVDNAGASMTHATVTIKQPRLSERFHPRPFTLGDKPGESAQ